MTATDSRPVVRSQVEPRIVARRRDVRDARRRRRRRGWIALGVVVALLAASVGVLWSPLTDVDAVAVTGADQLDPAELRDASGIGAGDQLVLVDLAAARADLRRLPMVAAASVRREWPGTVRISVVEEVPLLRVRSGERVRVVSRTGRVLPDGLDGVDALPELEVPATALDDGDQLPASLRPSLVVFARVPDTLRSSLAVARIGDDGALSFSLPDGGAIRFGPVEDVPAKLVAIQAFLEQVTLECLEVLDVSTSRVTASRAQGCAVPAPTEVDGTATEDTSATGATGSADGGTPG